MSYFNLYLTTYINGEILYEDSFEDENIYFDKIINNSPSIIITDSEFYSAISKKKLLSKNHLTLLMDKPAFETNLSDNFSPKFDDCLQMTKSFFNQKNFKHIFVMGGKSIIEQCLSSEFLEYIYLNIIDNKNTVNTKINITEKVKIDYKNINNYTIINNEEKDLKNYKINYIELSVNKYNYEIEYINLVKRVLQGKRKNNRTGIDTLSLWGESIRIDLTRFPLLTTKKVYFKGVVEELLFFLSGKTQTKILEQKNVNIWKGNTSREFLDKQSNNFINNLNEGDMGNGYGFQWRHFGASRSPNEQLELGQGGIDQIKSIIDNIIATKQNPSLPQARRLLVSAWNPVDIEKQVLPPCHYSFQFSVDDEYLHCLVNMRSNDIGCGTPFNIASYALLTYMIGNLTDLKPGKLILNIADAHIYVNHVESLKEQIKRPPRKWPTLEIINPPKNINDFTYDNFKLIDYNPHPEIKLQMAV